MGIKRYELSEAQWERISALLAVRSFAKVDMVFRDIDPNSNIRHLFRLLCLSSEPSNSGIRSGRLEKMGVITL